MEVTVHNFGSVPVENVAVLLAEDGRERPAITVDQIGAGQSETRRFEVFFPTAGTHQVDGTTGQRRGRGGQRALLPGRFAGGGAGADHRRRSRRSRTPHFLTTVFQPGGSAHTGLQPQVERPDFLNKHALESSRRST